MADYFLTVPFVTQLDFGSPTQPMRDYTGCWYASACMVNYYFEAGPRKGLPRLYNQSDVLTDTGNPSKTYTNNYHSAIDPGDFDELAANEGLEFVPLPTNNQWTPGRLDALLREFGPLAFGWYKTANGHSYGHFSVVCGIKSGPDRVLYHDPEKAANSVMSLADFNANFAWLPGGMMRRKKAGSGKVKLSGG